MLSATFNTEHMGNGNTHVLNGKYDISFCEKIVSVNIRAKNQYYQGTVETEIVTGHGSA